LGMGRVPLAVAASATWGLGSKGCGTCNVGLLAAIRSLGVGGVTLSSTGERLATGG
jgi:hypothetical protein